MLLCRQSSTNRNVQTHNSYNVFIWCTNLPTVQKSLHVFSLRPIRRKKVIPRLIVISPQHAGWRAWADKNTWLLTALSGRDHGRVVVGLPTVQPSIESEAAHLKRQVTWHRRPLLIGHLHKVRPSSDRHSAVERVRHSVVAVGLYLRQTFYRHVEGSFPGSIPLIKTFHNPQNSCYSGWLTHVYFRRHLHLPAHCAECGWCCCSFLSEGGRARRNRSAAWMTAQRWRLERGAVDRSPGARTGDHQM